MDSLTDLARKDYKRLEKFTQQSVKTSKRLINEAYAKPYEKATGVTYTSVSKMVKNDQERTFKDWLDLRGSTSQSSIRNFIPRDLDSVVSDMYLEKIQSVPADRQRLRQQKVAASYFSTKKASARHFSENNLKDDGQETVKSARTNLSRSSLKEESESSNTTKNITLVNKTGLKFPAVKDVSTMKNFKGVHLNKFSKIKSKFFKNIDSSHDGLAEASAKDSSKKIEIGHNTFAEEAKKAKKFIDDKMAKILPNKLSSLSPLLVNDSKKSIISKRTLKSPNFEGKKSPFANFGKTKDSTNSVSDEDTPPLRSLKNKLAQKQNTDTDLKKYEMKSSERKQPSESSVKLQNKTTEGKPSVRRMGSKSRVHDTLWMPRKKNVIYINTVSKKIRFRNMQRNRILPLSPL